MEMSNLALPRLAIPLSCKGALLAIAVSSTSAGADDLSFSTYGSPGLVETPSARTLVDGELAITSSYAAGSLRNTLTFQITPRLLASFRYSLIEDFFIGERNLLDRSFDLKFRFNAESAYFPAIAVGINDFVGTGVYTGEFVTATKQLLPGLDLNVGLGWGRFAGRNTFDNPLEIVGLRASEREFAFSGLGGQAEFGRFFQGPASFFGGVDYQVNELFGFQLEFSSDSYRQERNVSGQSIWSPFNFGLRYNLNSSVSAKGYLLGGREAGVQLNFILDPKASIVPGGREAMPSAIIGRDELGSSDWIVAGQADVNNKLHARLDLAGFSLDNLRLYRDSATVFVSNKRWGVQAQAAGRAARVLANTLPPQIEEFTVVFQERGVPLSSVTTNRSDLEDLQYDYEADWRTLARADINDASTDGAGAPKFDYSFGPYAAASFFDPQSPIRADFGAQLETSYQAAPGLTFDARLRYPLAGNLGDSERESDSVIPRVRSESFLFARESDLEINHLTAEYIWRPAPETFSRVTAGYLEDQFGGISSEVLWSPIDSRFALGAELNYVKQRDFDMLLGFQDYDVVTGHASAYYDLGNGFHSQVDVGRYLAGDWGGTLTVKREFNNGVKVGGYFTLTDVPFDDFGEGSFDKGLTLEIPLSFFTGQPSRRVLSQKIQPILRDGGARLNVQNRLYPLVRDYRGPELSDGWGRYLR